MFKIDNIIINDFCRGIHKPYLRTRHISNHGDVISAAIDVYGDSKIVARRMKGRSAISISISPFVIGLGEAIFNFFNSHPNTILNQASFDVFFYKICDDFKRNYNILAVRSNIQTIEFGVAQKIVNMIFKYLSCYEDYDHYADLFEYCHMPIDSYVLHYFDVHGIVLGIRSRFTIAMKSPTASFNGVGWSILTLEDYKNIVRQYRHSLMLLYPDNTFLHEEFYIWSYVKSRTLLSPIIFNPSSTLTHTITSFHL